MSTHDVIILIVVIIVGIILIKVIAKVLFKIIIFLAIVGAICYLLFFYNGGFVNTGKKEFILYELQSKYCTDKYDSVKCECIINPLIVDLKEKYTSEQIEGLSKDPVKTGKVLIQILNDNKVEIKACLKVKHADSAWEDFVKDIKSLNLGEKAKEVLKPFKTE